MSQMIEVKTAELTGPALNYATAVADGFDFAKQFDRIAFNGYCPSTDWEHGGPLIEKYGVAFLSEQNFDEPDAWVAVIRDEEAVARGATHLIAACLAIVAAKLGDTVSVPAELVQP